MWLPLIMFNRNLNCFGEYSIAQNASFRFSKIFLGVASQTPAPLLLGEETLSHTFRPKSQA